MSVSQLGFTVFMNIAGALFAIVAIMLYAVDLEDSPLIWVCDSSRNGEDYHEDKCRRMAMFVQVENTLLKRTSWNTVVDDVFKCEYKYHQTVKL